MIIYFQHMQDTQVMYVSFIPFHSMYWNSMQLLNNVARINSPFLAIVLMLAASDVSL